MDLTSRAKVLCASSMRIGRDCKAATPGASGENFLTEGLAIATLVLVLCWGHDFLGSTQEPLN